MSSQIAKQLFSISQWQQLTGLLAELDDQQSLWLSGYLAARVQSSAPAVGNGQSDGEPVVVAFGTETDNSRRLAEDFAQRCRSTGIAVECVDLADLRLRRLGKLRHLIVITATHGDGEPPEPIVPFYEALMAAEATAFADLEYAVLGLGDSSYEHFCATAIALDERLAALGGERLMPRLECDLDFAEPAARWLSQMLLKLPQTSANVDASPHTAVDLELPVQRRFSKQTPLTTEVLANQKLSDSLRAAPIHHLELALEETGFDVQPGDAIGVLVQNPPELVSLILRATGLSGEQSVVLGNVSHPLADVLQQHRDLTIPGQGLLKLWAEISGAHAIQALMQANRKEQRRYLRDNQVHDILRTCPARPEAQDLIDALRPLQPRLYDVANSLSVTPDELHLTVKTLKYPFAGRCLTGIASAFLLELKAGDQVQIYPHRNARFHLPAQPEAPLILLADSTGIAPYRAFLQQLANAGDAPPCWLIFSEKQFEQDFLYQLDIQRAHAAGTLTHVDTVFYDDQPGVSLDTPVVQQADRFKSWLKQGAHVYLCGDKVRLENCEASLQALVETEPELWDGLTKDKRIHRNLY